MDMIEINLSTAQEFRLRMEYVNSNYYQLATINGKYGAKYSYKNFVLDTVYGVIAVHTEDSPEYIYRLTFRDKESLVLFTLKYS